MTSCLAKVGDANCRVMRMSFVGELGYELQIPWNVCTYVFKKIWKKGKEYNLRHAGYRALYSLSAEKGKDKGIGGSSKTFISASSYTFLILGLRLWQSDLRNDDNPLEAGLETTCRLEGDYLGKEALGRVRFNGIRKKLAFFYPEK